MRLSGKGFIGCFYVNAAYKTFTAQTVEAGKQNFAIGSLVVPLVYQTISADSVYNVIKNAVAETNVQVYSVSTSASSEGIDLGSDNIIEVKKPVVATFVSTGGGYSGINWTAIGETWHLLGNHHHIPLTKISVDYADRTPLDRYTAIILVDGSYQNFSQRFVERLKNWVANGGVLITSQRASQWAIKNGIATHFATSEGKPVEDKKGEKAEKQNFKRLDYVSQREQNGPSRIGGVLYEADLDITNPLAFGIHSRQLYTMKSGNYILPRPQSPYGSLLQLKGDKQLGGYLTKQNQKLLKDATVIAFDNVGAGTVVLFSESPTYRGYWLSTSRILTNALFFGNNVSGASRYRP